ncbi:PREDICTED: uncharacterized protein LOC104601359 [Nelumbo nucifera]|uniref:HVA22-like protein n=1 Tax=Nelumbo nucifera TaxID=4432 RepID=A0A1U8A6R4_NELNU|nr:PREDICTED: uncharacterized protein LOC104601359 [Nelumbo nucifera]
MYVGKLLDAYKCCRDVEKKEAEDPHLRRKLREWCEYWITVILLDIFGDILDDLISSLPVGEKKLVILIFLCHPSILAIWRGPLILPPWRKGEDIHVILDWVFNVQRLLKRASVVLRLLEIFTGHYTKVEINNFQMLNFKALLRYVAHVYRAYCTIVKKNKAEIEELRRWCKYWIIIAILDVFEEDYEKAFLWFPMYQQIKQVFFFALSYSGAMGAAFIYEAIVAPYFATRKEDAN